MTQQYVFFVIISVNWVRMAKYLPLDQKYTCSWMPNLQPDQAGVNLNDTSKYERAYNMHIALPNYRYFQNMLLYYQNISNWVITHLGQSLFIWTALYPRVSDQMTWKLCSCFMFLYTWTWMWDKTKLLIFLLKFQDMF